ncbi:MAG: alpha-E domain-containing protein [Proteobacteria bacterium]|nr:alpha-E domain-containing protein [Pseudomonadota bacterium]MDA1324461.1 alpha-E domain-containing protein [Pseudomonadota bacterium]
MLGRTADSLYWMARYMERAENVSRILDVGLRMALIPSAAQTRESTWISTLEVIGGQEGFAEKYEIVNRDNVIQFLALDPDNPSSIYSSLRAARENGRALRGTITTEMWESLNASWLEIRDSYGPGGETRDHRDLFDWVKERVHLFRGVTNGTMLQDDSFEFIRLGWYVERAGNTARLLDSKYHILLPSADEVGGAVDYYQWGALLQSVSAFRAYHKIYSNVITPRRVAELLIMQRDLPRSLHASLNQITSSLDALCDRRPYECRRLAGELHARIAYGSMKDIISGGLHEFLTEFVEDSTHLGGQIQRDFLMLA